MTISREFEAHYAAWCARRKAERAAARLKPRKLFVRDPQLPMPRVWLHGPKWRGLLVRYVRGGRVHHHPRLYDFADDVRELVVRTEIRPGVIAEWSDPREWFR